MKRKKCNMKMNPRYSVDVQILKKLSHIAVRELQYMHFLEDVGLAFFGGMYFEFCRIDAKNAKTLCN